MFGLKLIFAEQADIRDQKFNSLEKMVAEDGKCSTKIRKRIVITKNGFNNLSKILTHQKTLLEMKQELLKIYVISKSSIWQGMLGSLLAEEERLEASDMLFYRSLLNIPSKEHVLL